MSCFPGSFDFIIKRGPVVPGRRVLVRGRVREVERSFGMEELPFTVGGIEMKLTDGLYAFLWSSETVNNCNTYLINGATRILIDPGHRRLFAHVERGLRELGIGLEDIGTVICTHSHPDHIEGAQLFKEQPALMALHQEDWELAKSPDNYMNSAFGVSARSVTPDFFLEEGGLNVNGVELEVLHTPGHSPGSICLYWPEAKALFTGDLVFRDGVGRTDIPGGNSGALKQSIVRIAEREVEWLLPGHGAIVSGSQEAKANFARIEQFWFALM